VVVVVPSWSRYFPGRPEQIAEARLFVLAVLAGRPEADVAALVVSELCTNAVCHSASGGPDGLFAVTVGREADRATVTVQDMGAAGEPEIAASAGDEPGECGRGLLLVAAVAKEWGKARNRLGWQVWAELASGDGEPGL
jgi:anti-sigma regulatory factor (Ser/Thr protein kinase)